MKVLHNSAVPTGFKTQTNPESQRIQVKIVAVVRALMENHKNNQGKNMEIYGLLNIFNALLMGINIAMFFGFFLGYKMRNNKLPAIISASIFAVIIVLINIFVPEPIDAYDFTSAACLLLYIFPYTLFVPKKRKTFFFASVAMNALIDYFQYIFEAFLDNSKSSVIISSGIYCIIYLLIIFAFIFLKNIAKIKIPENFCDDLPAAVYISFFFVEFSAFYAGEFTKDGLSNSKILSLILNVISTGLVCFSLMYMFYSYAKSSIGKKEAEMQLEMELKLYEKTIRNNNELRKFRHDYKNNLFSLNTFIQNRRYDEAAEYIEDLTGNLEASKSGFSSGNYLADAILTDKNNTASENGIRIDFSGTIPSDKIKNSDLCTILSNSLDNAIRACKNIENAVIRVEAHEKKQAVIIEITNPVAEKAEIKNNEIKTTKSDKKNHGFGIQSIKKAAEKYNGNVILSCDDHCFSIKIGLIFDQEIKK